MSIFIGLALCFAGIVLLFLSTAYPGLKMNDAERAMHPFAALGLAFTCASMIFLFAETENGYHLILLLFNATLVFGFGMRFAQARPDWTIEALFEELIVRFRPSVPSKEEA
jgi:uncharacterized membrane protein